MVAPKGPFLQNKHFRLLGKKKKKKDSIGAIGVILRDKQGQVIAAMCEPWFSIGGSTHLGVLSILHARWFARDLGLSKIIAEGDNRDVLSCLKNSEKCFASFENLVDDIL